MRNSIFYRTIGVLFFCSLASGTLAGVKAKRSETPLSITDLTALPDGNIVVTEKLTKRATVYTPDFSEIQFEVNFDQVPTGVAYGQEDIYVTLFEKSGELLVLDKQGNIKSRIATKSGTNTPVYNGKDQKLYVLNQFSNNVQEVDLQRMKVSREVDVLREPKGAVIDKSGKYLFVTNFLPAQRADVDTVAACVSVIDLKSFKKIKDIQLYNGSNALRGICLSPDGKYVFVTHNLGRFQVPTNQLQQGWMNTSAMSIIDVERMMHQGTVLLDEPERGAAGIWGIACTPEKVVITHSGTHEVSLVDYPEFIRRFEAHAEKEALAYDLRFLYGLRDRITLKGNGPRQFIIKENTAIVPSYFSDDMNLLSLGDKSLSSFALVENRQESREMKGEKYFNDAAYCFQNWQSCNGCHPGDARTDGMNWDLLNDGLGNSKNCKSMLYSHVTPPAMISGIRDKAETAVRKGFTHIQFAECPEDMATCVDDYLRALRPVPSPWLVNGELSEKAKKGRKVFDKLNCASCHSGPYYTDMQMHRIGDDVEFEKGWDTPTLVEVWRTAPYLFDGRAATLKDVFKIHKHGVDSKISEKELDELTEYVNSL
ncbi:MAG: YVTN family beta-propeller repeat-containing protein [Bacteroidales bacterium]